MDRALRGNRLTKKPKVGKPKRMAPKRPREEWDSLEGLGTFVSGVIEGKPHSTKEGRRAAGARELTRFFYGRKKKGVKV